MHLSSISLALRQQFSGLAAYSPSLLLDLTSGNQTLDPRITFSRTSNATVTGPDGLIAYAPNNLLTYSEQVDNSAWTKVNLNVTANTVVAPDGTLTADVVSRTADGSAIRNTRANFSTTQTGSYTYSQYVKPQGATVRVVLRLQDNFGVGGHCGFDLEGAGTIVATSSATGFVEKVGDWYRIAVTVSLTGSFSATQSLMFLGTYGASTDPDSFAMWGAQLNVGALQPYYPTTVKNLLGYTQEFDNAAWTKSNAFVQTNLLLQSEAFDSASWTKNQITVSANSTTAPDGSMTADTMTGDGTSAVHNVQNATGLSFTAAAYTISVFAKANTNNFIQLRFFAGIGGAFANFDLSTGAVGTSGAGATASIQSFGSGWYRCVMTATTLAAASAGAGLYLVNSASAGSAETNALSTSIFLWGAQLVQGSTPGDYQRTEAAANAVMYPAPDGSMTADRVVPTTATTSHTIAQSFTTVAGQVFTLSYYVKADGYRWVQLTGFSSQFGSGQWVNFDLENGVVGNKGTTQTNETIVSLGNGWYRCSMTITATASASGNSAYILMLNSNVNARFPNATGDGTSGIFIWGAQLSDSASLDQYVYNPVAAPAAAAYYGPRFDYDPVTLAPKGLLIEEQRTNLLLQSEAFNSAVWGKLDLTVITNAIVAPDGTLTAEKLVDTTSNILHYVVQPGLTVSANTNYAYSVYVKAGEYSKVRIRYGRSASPFTRIGIVVNLSDGTFTNADVGTPTSVALRSVTPVGNGWYRIAVAGIFDTTGTIEHTEVALIDDAGNATFAGNGYSGLYVWGAQLEVGAFATSYIPTTTAAATRAADVALMQGANFSNWYNAAEGTLYAESRCPNGTASNINRIASLNDGTASNRIEIDTGSAGLTVVRIQVNGTSQGSPAAGSYTDFQLRKSALAIQVDNFTIAANTATSSDTSALVAVVNRLMIGQSPATSSNYLNGHISRIAYYPRRLSDAELQGITS